MKLFFQILVGIGFFFLVAAGFTYVQSTYFVSHAVLTTGKVVALSMLVDPDDNTNSYCPEVRYTTKTGQVISFEGNTCSSPAAYKIGDQVELYYDPQNPQGAQIKKFASQYLVSVSLVIAGLPVAIFGILGLFIQKKRKNASQDIKQKTGA